MNTNASPRTSHRARLAAVLAVSTTFVILGVVAALALPAGGAASAATAPTASTTPHGASNSASIKPALGVYFGQVAGDTPSCEGGRTVELFHVERGGDRLAGTATQTDSSGSWAVHTDPNATGSFYVKVIKTDSCPEVTSGVVQSIAIPVMN